MILLAIIGGLLLFAALAVYGAFSWGLVFMKFYYWFLLPVFTTLPHITFWHAVGIMFVIALFERGSALTLNAIKKEYKDNTMVAIGAVLAPWMTLLVGYLFYIIFIIQ
jgi:hypothetical protein